MKHIATDPECVKYKEPQSAVDRAWRDYCRGLICQKCRNGGND